MITIKTDGTLYPLNVIWTNQSQFQLMAPTRDIAETIDGTDGEIDFGTELGMGEYQLHCLSEEGLTKEDIAAQKATLAGLLNAWRNYDLLVWESDPDKGIYARLSGRIEFIEHPAWFEVTIPIKYQPLWVSVTEHTQVGSGIITNEGTFNAPVGVEIEGQITNPSVAINDKTMAYDGSLASGDILIIDTDKQTAKFNGVNAIEHYNNVFPKLQPGENSVIADDNTIIKWRHCWI